MARSVWVRWFVAIAIVAIVMTLLLGQGPAYGFMFAGAVACAALFTQVLRWPLGQAFIEKRPKTIVAVGASAIAAGVFGCVAVFLASLHGPSFGEGGFVVGMVIGVIGYLVLSLPRMAKHMATARIAIAGIKARGPAPPAFDGVNEGLRSPIRVARDWRAFLQISGPWALLPAAGLVALAVTGDHLGHDPTRLTIQLLGLLVLILVLLASVPVVGVAWCRWIIEGRLPTRFVALPDRAMWSWLLRLWLFAVILGGSARLIAPYVTGFALRAHMPVAVSIGDAAGALVDVLAVMLASNMALRLPAIAVGDRDFVLGVANVQGRTMWPGLPFGLVLSAVAFYALGRLFDQAYEVYLKPKVAPGHVGLLAAASLGPGLLIAHACVASASTYLSRAYLAAKATLE